MGNICRCIAADLQIINTTILKEKTDLFVKAIISGSKYSPEQAIKDSQAAWDKAGGKQLEDFMNKWYRKIKIKRSLLRMLWQSRNNKWSK